MSGRNRFMGRFDAAGLTLTAIAAAFLTHLARRRWGR